MKNTTNPNPNYVDYDSTFQMFLPLNLQLLIEEDDMVFSFLKALKGVNLAQYLTRAESRGRKGYDRELLLKTLLFAYSLNIRELRDIADACAHDIRFMYLIREERPSHMAFERLINNYLVSSIDDIYRDITNSIAAKMNIDRSKIYIDGTKIEANANKYTFVYKKRIINARKKLWVKLTAAIQKLNTEYGYNYQLSDYYCAQEIGYIVQYLLEVMIQLKVLPVYGRGHQKSDLQREYDEFMGYYCKLLEYEYWLSVLQERNSCSKTDHDATMCCTKLDYYCNTGLTRPCYNAQIGVSDGIIMHTELYQMAGDTKTFIPFMQSYKEMYGSYPLYPMADAAYGSYDNYLFCLNSGMKPVMKYTMYAKKNEAKFKKQQYNALNWSKDEKGHVICPAGYAFDQYIGSRTEEIGEYPRIIDSYKCGKCEGCQHRSQCCKGNRDRVYSRNKVLEELYSYVDEFLGTEEGKELKKQRSIQAEGAFGVIKQDMEFTRFTRRGLKNAGMEFKLVCLAYNIRKYHQYVLKQKQQTLN